MLVALCRDTVARGMWDDASLEMTARLVAALYVATRGRTGVFVTVADVAQRAAIPEGDVERIVELAERAGFVGRYIGEPRVMLTERGAVAARPARG